MFTLFSKCTGIRNLPGGVFKVQYLERATYSVSAAEYFVSVFNQCLVAAQHCYKMPGGAMA